MKFCVAIVMSRIKKVLFEPISDENLFNLMILDMVTALNLRLKNGETYYVDKAIVSRLMTNKRNVPNTLKKALSKEPACVNRLERHFAKVLIPKLIPEKCDGLCKELIECYSEYDGASDDVLAEINTCYEEKNTARLMAYMFRLSLAAPNKFDRTAIDKKKPYVDIDRRHSIKAMELPDDNNIRCLRAILEAYSSTMANAENKRKLDDYPQYKRHFQRQKEAYFAAEAVRHASRDSFLEEEDPFEDLLDESFDGIIETWEKKYANGLERMDAVLAQAVQISMESNLISRETAWVTVKVKKGLCHMLVNEGRIDGWTYDESI